ncbi:MAG: hypothetical protein M1436_04335 [Acidobacteria bacterium]|nr:hypothetical protein [Acidobacteriota bacterium]
MNTLHLHGDKVYLRHFAEGWPAAAINYSSYGTGVSITDLRRDYKGVLMGGLDEVHFRNLSEAELKQQWMAARKETGRRFILTPGCSVPNDSTDAELLRLPKSLRA